MKKGKKKKERNNKSKKEKINYYLKSINLQRI